MKSPQTSREKGQRPGKVRVAAQQSPNSTRTRRMLGKRRRMEELPGPSYAILKLRPDTDCVLLFQHALSLGISDISFVTHPREFFAACPSSSEPALLPSRTPDTPGPGPHDEPVQGTSYNADAPTSPRSESPIDVINNPKSEIRSPSADSSVETESDQVHHVLATLFGKAEGSLPPSCSDETPVIPSNGTTVCKICGAATSCRKITNLSLHVLRSHCAVPLWRCPLPGCEFSHADSGKVKNHLRNQHSGDESPPMDNRTLDMLDCARISLTKCFPNVDWTDKYQNVFYLTDPPTVVKEEKKAPVDPLMNWERLVIRESNVNQPMRCHGCQLTVPLNKKAIEEHIRVIHKPERPLQCGVCEYANPDEWKVRLHMSVKHADKPFVQMRSCSSWNRPYLYVRKYFPELAESLPVDEFESLLESFKPPPPPVIREVPGLSGPPPMLPVAPTVLPDPPNLTDATVESLLLQMFPAIRNGTPLSATHAHRKPSNGTTMRVDRLGGKVECSLCLAQVEAKRTMLVSHCKSHCPQRQWQCPHCETSAAFHSKLKLHIVNAHKSDAEPLDHYTPDLENKWLLLFRQCFPGYAMQCYQEDWKFRSKQQQHYGNHMDDSWTRSLEGAEQPRRAILVEGESPAIEPTSEIKPQIETKLI